MDGGRLVVLFGVAVWSIVDGRRCPAYTCNNGRCVPYSSRCDYSFDCSDFSDEYDCLGCPTTFSCGGGRICTTFISDRCDGHIDCPDGSDEYNCNGTSVTTTTRSRGPSSSNDDGITVAYILPGVMFIIIVTGCVLTIKCCCLCYKNRRTRSAAGGSSLGNQNVSTNIVPTPVPIRTTKNPTATNSSVSAPAYTVSSTLQQEPPPSYSNANAYPQQPSGAYPLQLIGAYPQQSSDIVYPPQQQPPGAYPSKMYPMGSKVPYPSQKQAGTDSPPPYSTTSCSADYNAEYPPPV